MSAPIPPSDLEGHCSTIYDETLYVLSPDSFLSLPLKEKAKWSQRPMGVPVMGPACVQAGEGADAGLYVIGGKTSKSGYNGMQKYNFAQQSWETLPVSVDVLSSRTDHSAAYIADTQQILVYAGSQPDAYSYLSSQTFLVSTQSPYELLAFTSSAPPGNLPLLQTWDTGHAVMLGGSDFNTEIYTFGPSDGWLPLGTNLTGPLDPSARATLIDGSDGSKVLQMYDMSTNPNSVSQVVLLGAGGQTAYTGQTVGTAPSSRKRKRDLTLDSWPPYNDNNAPSVTRTDCGVAQGSDGMAVISGGSSEAPVAIFNQDRNSWVDVDKFFDSKQQQPLKPTKSSSVAKSTPSSTMSSSPTSSTTAAATSGSGESAHDRMLRTLGITLGVLCGIAAVFIAVLLFLRWRKLKKRKQEGYLDEKNDGARMSFADRGASFMKEAGGSINGLAPPNKAWNDSQNTSNNGSHSSLAIIAGKFGGNKRSTSGHEPKASYDSTAPFFKETNGGEPMEMVSLDEKRVERKPLPGGPPPAPPALYGPNLTPSDANRMSTDSGRGNRSSGWSKYFATSQPTGPNGISHLPSAYAQTNKLSDASLYSNDRNMSQVSQIPSSALVPPLDIDFSKTVDGQRLSHVTSGSPAFNDSREDLARGGSNLAPQGQQGLIVDPYSRRSGTENIATLSTTTSVYNHDSNPTPWTPTSTSFKDHLVSRPPSSVYAPSEPRVPSRGKNGGGFFPGSGTSYRPSTRSKMGSNAAPSGEWASPTKPLSVPNRFSKPAEDRDSTVTVFPKGVPSAYYAGRDKDSEQAKPVNSDLGWLNLGLGGGSPQPPRI